MFEASFDMQDPLKENVRRVKLDLMRPLSHLLLMNWKFLIASMRENRATKGPGTGTMEYVQDRQSL